MSKKQFFGTLAANCTCLNNWEPHKELLSLVFRKGEQWGHVFGLHLKKNFFDLKSLGINAKI